MSENEIRNDAEKHDEFDYSYSSPNSEERRWIESIRREYLPQDEHDVKLAEMKKLHKKAKKVPTVIATCMGILGSLIAKSKDRYKQTSGTEMQEVCSLL